MSVRSNIILTLVAGVVFLVTPTASLAETEKPRELAYLIERISGDTARFRVSVSFEGELDGSTKIELPNEWGGQTALYRSISHLRVISDGAMLSHTELPHISLVTHRPGQKVTIEYFVVQDFNGPFKNSIRYRPVVDDQYIHWIGSTVWVHPEMPETTVVDVTFDWKGFASGSKFANSYGLQPDKQKRRLSLEDLGRSITVAGDFRVETVKVGSRPVYVALRGNWQFKDAELAEMIRKVIFSQREFWNDHSQEYYLVTLVPIDEGPDAYSFGGTGLLNSFALFATPNANVEGLRGLLAHEYFHNWNPVQIGKMPQPEQQMYWLSEGFTEFYAYELLNRSGLITDQDYIDEVNQRIRDYYLLPTRTEPNERIVKDFWNDRDVGRLPYLRGMFFAMNLNSAIVHATAGRRSLDDVMHEMYRRAKLKKDVLSPELLSEVVSKFAGAAVSSRMLADLKAQITDGGLIKPNDLALGTRASLKIVDLPSWELGLNVDELLRNSVISGVKPNTAAYTAGLRNGQKVVGRISISLGDTTKEVKLKVLDGRGEKVIEYLPVATQRLLVPQFRKAL